MQKAVVKVILALYKYGKNNIKVKITINGDVAITEFIKEVLLLKKELHLCTIKPIKACKSK